MMLLGQFFITLLLVFGDLPDKNEQHRVEEYSQYGRQHHPSEQGDTHDLSRLSTSTRGQDQWKNSQDERKRRSSGWA